MFHGEGIAGRREGAHGCRRSAAGGGFGCAAERDKQNAGKDGNDADDYQQFNKRESACVFFPESDDARKGWRSRFLWAFILTQAIVVLKGTFRIEL